VNRRRLGSLLAPAALVALLGVAAPASGAPAAADDIRDIHGPVAPPRRPSPWWAVGAGAVLATAAVGGALWSRRGRRLAPPDVRALRALADQRALVGEDARGFAVAVSETVRAYLEEAFAVHAPRLTTDELLARLVADRSGPLAPVQFELTEFLRQCDLAKFAGAALSPARMNAMLDSAEALVRATAAPPVPAPAPAAGVAR
jgi:hypothetical protein